MESRILKKLILGIILTLLLSVLAFDLQQVEAEQRKVGVKVGDWAKYDYMFNYTTNDPNPIVYPSPTDVDYVMVKVQSISGTLITFQGIIRFNNGTETVTDISTDIAGTSSMGTPFFIAANLTAGDLIFPYVLSPMINATLMRNYAGMEREVNYLSLTQNTTGPYPYPTYTKMEMYWDRTSGILTEMDQIMHYTSRIPEGYFTKIWMYLELVETNIWEPIHTIAEVKFSPKVLNLRSRGNCIQARIKLPEEYNVNDINPSTIMLNGIVAAEPTPRNLGDYGLIVKFNRQEIIELILLTNQLDRFRIVELTITGKLNNGTPFSGSGTIKVISVPEHIIPI